MANVVYHGECGFDVRDARKNKDRSGMDLFVNIGFTSGSRYFKRLPRL